MLSTESAESPDSAERNESAESAENTVLIFTHTRPDVGSPTDFGTGVSKKAPKQMRRWHTAQRRNKGTPRYQSRNLKLYPTLNAPAGTERAQASYLMDSLRTRF